MRGTPWAGLHPHAFRHLVATRLDRAGLAREIADYLGHERISMTQDVYMSRQATGVDAGARWTARPERKRGVNVVSILSGVFRKPVTCVERPRQDSNLRPRD